jgi:hypothetical protein
MVSRQAFSGARRSWRRAFGGEVNEGTEAIQLTVSTAIVIWVGWVAGSVGLVTVPQKTVAWKLVTGRRSAPNFFSRGRIFVLAFSRFRGATLFD